MEKTIDGRNNPADLGDWVQTADTNQKVEKFPMWSRPMSPAMLLVMKKDERG